MWGHRSRSDFPGRPAETVGADVAARALGIRAARLSAVPNGTRVRLYAVARGSDVPLASPVMGRTCIAYRLVVERPARQQLLERTACTPFLAQDGDVTLSVNGPFAVVLDGAYQWEFGTDVQRRIWRLAMRMNEGIYRQDYRYFEALIRPGDRVSIEGFSSVTVDPAGERTGLRQPPLLYTVTGTAERPAIISVPERGSVAP